jgi:hypothetical protein
MAKGKESKRPHLSEEEIEKAKKGTYTPYSTKFFGDEKWAIDKDGKMAWKIVQTQIKYTKPAKVLFKKEVGETGQVYEIAEYTPKEGGKQHTIRLVEYNPQTREPKKKRLNTQEPLATNKVTLTKYNAETLKTIKDLVQKALDSF